MRDGPLARSGLIECVFSDFFTIKDMMIARIYLIRTFL
jgi:hypothetical protein